MNGVILVLTLLLLGSALIIGGTALMLGAGPALFLAGGLSFGGAYLISRGLNG